ncbi:cytochrome P450 [Okibacterium endophyticum]
MRLQASGARNDIPTLRVPDSSLGFLRDGYLFGTRRFRAVGADGFHTRIAGLPVTVMHGSDAARIFYEGGRFGRERAMPTSVLHLLQDEGSVQTLSAEPHTRRKMLFVRMLSTQQALAGLREIFVEELREAVGGWPAEIVLHNALQLVLTRTVLRWTGISADDVDVPKLAGELGSMIENAGRFGPPNWIARARRRRTEAWAERVIDAARAGRFGDETPVAAFAEHVDENGELLPAAVAAVELLNVLRPTVAVARFMVFAVHALHTRGRWRDQFAAGDDTDVLNFVHEVRRFYPFFPVIGGRVEREFEWRGHRFGVGDWVMLDLYGTNHDPRLWFTPERFTPERFRDWSGDRNALIPQGAGEAKTGHRCPGEQATVELMAEAVRVFSRDIDYTVPDQDLRISLRRFPALPPTGLLLTAARLRRP